MEDLLGNFGHGLPRAVADLIKDEIRAAGGVPFEFDTIAVCDGIAMGHAGMKMSLPSRELIADSVETMLRAHCFDGVICIPNCDKIVPGMVLATLRVNIPAIFASGGPMLPGVNPVTGAASDLNTVFEAVAEYKNGKITEDQLTAIESTSGEGYIDTGVKIIIGVVVGAVILVIRKVRQSKTGKLTALDFGTGAAGEKIFSGKRLGVALGITAITVFVAFTWLDWVVKFFGVNYQFFCLFAQINRPTAERLLYIIPYLIVGVFLVGVINIKIAPLKSFGTSFQNLWSESC